MIPSEAEDISSMVRERYGSLARGKMSSCGDDTHAACCVTQDAGEFQTVTDDVYPKEEIEDVPKNANMGLGCGNPLNIARLQPGETVLDLGSGGGFDCFLAARKVGMSGKVIGVDMTIEMIDKARQNSKKGDFANVEFKLANIEDLPIEDNSVDVIISNCVINLSPQKKRVFAEALRVLKPGGRLAIADIVALQKLPKEIKDHPELYCSCVAGAETVDVLRKILIRLGYTQLKIELCNYNRKNNVASASIEAQKPLKVSVS